MTTGLIGTEIRTEYLKRIGNRPIISPTRNQFTNVYALMSLGLLLFGSEFHIATHIVVVFSSCYCSCWGLGATLVKKSLRLCRFKSDLAGLFEQIRIDCRISDMM